jgi:hypothetical protein
MAGRARNDECRAAPGAPGRPVLARAHMDSGESPVIQLSSMLSAGLLARQHSEATEMIRIQDVSKSQSVVICPSISC